MQKTEIVFAVESKNGIVQRIGRSEVLQQKTNFKGEQKMNWYEDKPKKKDD